MPFDYNKRHKELKLKVVADSDATNEVNRVFVAHIDDMLHKWHVFPIPVIQYNNLWLTINEP